ncbi:secreted protein [Colletotrichum asianum]
MRVTALISFALALVAAIPMGGDTPPLDQVRLVDVNYGGSGCPAGSVAKSFSDDRDIVTLMFDQYNVQSGPDIKPVEHRKACQLNVKMHYPQGYQFSIFQSTVRGHVNLAKGVEGYCKATYYFSGDEKSSPCGTEGMLNIKTAIELNPLSSAKASLMTVDSNDLKVTQKYYVQWRKCKGTGQ